jgi:hypothetical protein
MTIAVQASFNSGEWAPSLYARVDVAKYKSGAALLQNWFVDYRGGASTRAGTKYVIQALNSAKPVRLIPFQATSTVGYMLEFGDFTIRFIFQGSMVLENSFAVSGATQANPAVITVTGNNFIIGDVIFLKTLGGMTQLNSRYFKVLNVSGASVTLGDLNGNNLNSTTYSAYTSGGTAARVYTLASPYAAADVAGLKYAQATNEMILCHPNYAPQVLTEISATSWTIGAIVFGSTATAPGAPVISSSLSSGSVNYAYVVTSVDGNGQESLASPVANYLNAEDIRVVAGSISIAWTAVPGAISYNVYKSDVSYIGTVPTGTTFGFIGNSTGTTFIDSNIAPDFTETPPIATNPFQGAGISAITVTAAGTYTVVPSATIVGTATIVASVSPVLTVQGTPTIGSGGAGYAIGDTVLFSNGVVLVVATLSGSAVATWRAASFAGASPGAVTSGTVPVNPVAQIRSSGAGTGATANLTWGVGYVSILNGGAGYTPTPTITFGSGAATATVSLQPTSNGNPTVPGFFQQRLVLAAPPGAPQTFYLSKPGAFFNFNQSSPPKADDSIQGTLVSGVLNTIQSIVSSTSGMLLLTDKGSWIVNGGSSGSAVTPSSIVANAQSFNGASAVRPIVANYDVLYIQEKGSSARDLAFNIYFNVFTGTDISILPSHLFFGFQILDWTWAEEPFKVVWAVRNDGALLSLTFLKEQDFTGWAHSITAGNFKSVASVTEASGSVFVDAVYVVAQRTINGNSVQYVERMADRILQNNINNAFCVDAGLSYSGSPSTTFTGAEQLANATVTGLADGLVITPFTMPPSGIFTLNNSASNVSIGLAYTCDLQTLALEMGEPSIQGKVKKIPCVDIRVTETQGMKIGVDFNHLTSIKDLIPGNVSSTLTGQQSQIVSGLITGDAKTILSPAYTVPGQYCIRQDQPLPATILGVFPEFEIENRQ